MSIDPTVLSRIDAYWAAYGEANAWNFVTSNLHNGDLYSVLTLLRLFRKAKAGGRPMRLLAIGRTHAQIGALFGDVLDEVVATPVPGFSARDLNRWRVVRGCDGVSTGTPILLNFIDYVEPPLAWGALWFLFNERNIFYMHLFKFLTGLQLDAAPSLPSTSPYARSGALALIHQHQLPTGKTLVLFPYARTPAYAQHPDSVRAHCAALVPLAAAQGIEVCTSVVGTEEPIPGTRGVFIPFDLLVPFCELAGHAITVRSGISDMLATAQCRKLHVYPSQWAADRASPLALGLGGIEHNLAFDLVNRPDPSGFAETVMGQLLGPMPVDGSAHVPAAVRRLLHLTVDGIAPDGRFRHPDFVVASEHYRLFGSGVLAEGWSAAEDWGTWTLGYRAILYLRAAVTQGLDPARVADHRIVLLLDLQFAIAPDTHEVLDYAIEVNGDTTYHQARWPDRWRVLRIPLSPDALAAPVRVTFTTENPVSSRVLSNGGNDDDRVIGIGLLKATYDVAQTSDA